MLVMLSSYVRTTATAVATPTAITTATTTTPAATTVQRNRNSRKLAIL